MNAEVELLQKKLLDIDGPKAELAQVDSGKPAYWSIMKTLRTAGQIFKQLIPDKHYCDPASWCYGRSNQTHRRVARDAGRRAEQAYVRREEQTKFCVQQEISSDD